jgi:hypothetical protein
MPHRGEVARTQGFSAIMNAVMGNDIQMAFGAPTR